MGPINVVGFGVWGGCFLVFLGLRGGFCLPIDNTGEEVR